MSSASASSSCQMSSTWKCHHNLPAIVKTTKRGENVGRKYYGCSEFPPCKFFEWYDGQPLCERGVVDADVSTSMMKNNEKVMEDKDKMIERLEKVIESKDNMIESKEKTIEKKDRQIAKLEAKVDKLKNKNVKLTTDYNELRVGKERVERVLSAAAALVCVLITLLICIY